MLALLIIDVQDVIVLICIVESKRNLGVNVQISAAIKIISYCKFVSQIVDFFFSQKINIFSGLFERILKCSRIKGLVGRICTGIDDSDLASGSGISGIPGSCCAYHGR